MKLVPKKLQTPTLSSLLKDREATEQYIEQLIKLLEKVGLWQWFEDQLHQVSTTDPRLAYPNQGLILTAYDEKPAHLKTSHLSSKQVNLTLKAWLYYLVLFNHSARLKNLFAISDAKFVPPGISKNDLLENTDHEILGINEFALIPSGADRNRTKRSERFEFGPFIKLGKQARTVFVGSANPDIWGSSLAIASMAMAHCLSGVPRDGFFSDMKRQADLARKAFGWFKRSPALIGKDKNTRQRMMKMWRHNVMGVLEADPDKALARAEALYKVGVRTFRIYSPEPGLGPIQSLIALRQHEKKADWEPLEIFVGQVVSLKQARSLEKAGADGIYLGIGGGGRCTTGVRSGVGINWPQLVWQMRGRIKIPMIVEGGGSDYVAQTLSLGATGIGVTRAVGGATIESPGGYLYFSSPDDRRGLWKPYRGEASAGMKSMGSRIGPFGFIPYVEGEATRAYMEYGRDNIPTLLQKLNLLIGDSVMAMVFQNAQSISELQQKGAKALRLSRGGEMQLRKTH